MKNLFKFALMVLPTLILILFGVMTTVRVESDQDKIERWVKESGFEIVKLERAHYGIIERTYRAELKGDEKTYWFKHSGFGRTSTFNVTVDFEFDKQPKVKEE